MNLLAPNSNNMNQYEYANDSSNVRLPSIKEVGCLGDIVFELQAKRAFR